jgi:hypothetical protein
VATGKEGEMNEEQKQLIRETVKEAVTSWRDSLPCYFNPAERSTVHALHEVMTEEDGNHGTLRVIIQFGKSFQDITKTLRRTGLLLLLLLLLLLGLKVAPHWRFWE